MTQGDQLGGSLGCLNAGETRNLKWIAFRIIGQSCQHFRGERDEGRSFRLAACRGLVLMSTILASPDSVKCESLLMEIPSLGAKALMCLHPIYAWAKPTPIMNQFV